MKIKVRTSCAKTGAEVFAVRKYKGNGSSKVRKIGYTYVCMYVRACR